MAKYIMALDAGTTSNRCILFNEQGGMCSVAQKEFTQYFPQPGWVEHDANEIWSTQIEVAQRAMANIGATAADIAAIGITNQRETTIVWDRKTGEPVCRAIVWQCRRTSAYCDELKEKGLVEEFRGKTGLRGDGIHIFRRPDSDCGSSGRPAGGAVRPDLLPARRSQKHLRHRLFYADEHRG